MQLIYIDCTNRIFLTTSMGFFFRWYDMCFVINVYDG